MVNEVTRGGGFARPSHHFSRHHHFTSGGSLSPKPVCLKLNGAPLEIHPPSPSIARLREMLDAQPADELFTTAEVLKRFKISIHLLDANSAHDLADYRHICNGHQRYWGSRKAIAELRRQLAAAQ